MEASVDEGIHKYNTTWPVTRDIHIVPSPSLSDTMSSGSYSTNRDTRHHENALRACEILNNVIRFPATVSTFQCLPIALGQIYAHTPMANDPICGFLFTTKVFPYVNRSDIRYENHPPDKYYIINENGVDHVLSVAQRHKKSLRACEILNADITFEDFKEISAFRCVPTALGQIYVQGPSYTYKKRNESALILDEEKFIQRVAQYVGRSQTNCESHQREAYFIINEQGVDQVLDTQSVKQIFRAEYLLAPQRKHVPLVDTADNGFNRFIRDEYLDPRLLDEVHKFLP